MVVAQYMIGAVFEASSVTELAGHCWNWPPPHTGHVWQQVLLYSMVTIMVMVTHAHMQVHVES